ncbi:MAG: SMC family ATPase, partial [Spirochaetes bacterium]|nr:SMC family ATPase [Spirochaetota bacterium]
MRIKSLKLENFGSYKNAEIGFTKVSNSPIVIITGDTGSGKSTILDGIVFSLYQTMFRYGRDDIKSVLSSLSNQSSASSELTFSLDSSKSDYRIKRTFDPSNGSNSYSVEISRKSFGDDQWLRFSDTKMKLDEKIKKEILKCSPELFFRSVVLPQGQFASLLKTDDPETRRKIIMEIFSEVKIYDEIKKLISKKYSEVEEELRTRRDKINHIKDSIKKSIQDLSEQGVDIGDISKFDQEFDQNYNQYLNDTFDRIDKKLKELETSKQVLERERNHKQEVLQTQKSELDNIEQVLKNFGILKSSRESAVEIVKSINSSLIRRITDIDTNILNAFASGDALDYSEYINYVRGIIDDFKSRTETNKESLERIITQYEVRRRDYQNILDLEQKFIVSIKNNFQATKYKSLVDSITGIQDAKNVLEQIYDDVQTELQSKNKELQSLKDE